MLSKLKQFAANFLKAAQEARLKQAMKYSYTYRLEQYLKDKNVTTTADVDYWIKRFDGGRI